MKSLRVLFTTLLITAFSVTTLSAAYTKFNTINTFDGLAHTDVSTVVEDSDGYIWFATSNGLQSFDGYKLTTYDYYQTNPRNVRRMENRIIRIAECGDMLFLATKSGVTIFDKTTREFVEYSVEGAESGEVQDSDIFDVVADVRGYIYIKLRYDIFVAKYNRESSELLIIEHFEGKINGVDVDRNVDMWRACDGVYFVMRYGGILHAVVDESETVKTRRYGAPKITKGSQTITGSYYKDDKFYLRCNAGIVVLNVNESNGNINTSHYNYHLYHRDYAPNSLRNNDIVVDNNENIWYNIERGLVKVSNLLGSNPQHTLFSHDDGDMSVISTNYISNLFISSDNTLWISTWGGGVNFTSTLISQFGFITKQPSDQTSIHGNFVKSMERDSDGYLWIATQEYGVDKYSFEKGAVVDSYSVSKLYNANIIKSLKISSDQRYIYIGSLDGLSAIDIKNGSTRKIMTNDQSAEIPDVTYYVYSMDIDKWGNLWCATWNGGVIVLREGAKGMEIVRKIDVSTEECALSSNIASNVVCDDSRVWISTFLGLNAIKLNESGEVVGNTIYRAEYEKEGSLSSNFISCVAPESESVLWVGTIGGGLNRVTLMEGDRYHSEVFTTSQGLNNNDVECVEIDSEGNIWISAGHRITKFEYPARKVTSFGVGDGLQNNTFKLGSHYQDKNGTLFFGGTNGLCYFNPQYIQPEKAKGKLVFSEMLVRDETNCLSSYKGEKFVNYVDEIELENGQNSFSIEFSALNFAASDNVRYRYRLEGLNNNWTEYDREYNKAVYSDVNYRHYTFRVEASYDGGRSWDESGGREIGIRVIPPWHQSNFAYTIYILLVIFLIVVIFLNYRERTKMKLSLKIKNLEQISREENHQMKLQFFTNISHEFRTPLTIIMTAIESIRLNLDDGQYELVDSITRNTKKMLTLISQLMDFRKTETQRDKLYATNEIINSHIREIVTEFDVWAQKKDISLKYSEQREMELWFDREKITKIIWNLISNAIKYTDKGGTIRVSLSEEDYNSIKPYYNVESRYVGDEQMGRAVVLRVRDSGIGINEQSLPHIFDRYFQIVSKTSLHLGSGIGLAVVKNMVLSHFGNLIVSSRRSHGTEFIVAIALNSDYIPEEARYNSSKFSVEQYLDQEYIEQELQPVEELEMLSDESEECEQLLIVEDNVELLALLRKHFAARYNVITAVDGEEGLRMVREHNPDLIISDVMMPKMDGVEMVRHIRESLRTTSTPIILLTAKSAVEDQIAGMESGADIYLSKPFTTRILDLHISRLLSYREQVVKQSEEEAADVVEVAEGVAINQRDQEFIERVTALVTANLDNTSYSIAMMCEELAIGRTRLYTKIKEIRGESLGDMIRDIRITKAAELLLTTDKNISEVTYEVGIGSNSHFSKAFKQRYGVTPSEYVKEHRS